MLELKIATEDDLPEIIAASKEHHTEYLSNMGGFSEVDVESLARKLIQADSGDAVIILAWDNRKVCTGVLALFKSILPFSGESITSELAWWVHPEYRTGKTMIALFQAAEFWAVNVAKTDRIQFGVPNTNGKMNRFFEKHGYTKQEEIWRK